MSLRTVEQLRQARAALGWTQAKVAEAAGVSLPTIKRLESGRGNLAIRFETLTNLEAALTEQGIQFLADGEVSQGPGVALRPNSAAKQD